MIYTITFNPALDYSIYLDQLTLGGTNRAAWESLSCGGKGINVSIILKRLGVASVALGFLAGFTGKMIQSWVEELGVRHDFILLSEGMSRINVKLSCGGETELNGRGPDISPQALDTLYKRLGRLTQGDTLVLAGSIPARLPPDSYQQLLSRLAACNFRLVVDATGALLANTLQYHPFLIKPNHEELGQLCQAALSASDTEQITSCAKQLQAQGARNVLVSMAGDGALLVTEDGRALYHPAAQGKVISSVGAGDSMVAGFLAGYQQNGSYLQALRLGVAAGSATAFSSGLATADEIGALYCQDINF